MIDVHGFFKDLQIVFVAIILLQDGLLEILDLLRRLPAVVVELTHVVDERVRSARSLRARPHTMDQFVHPLTPIVVVLHIREGEVVILLPIFLFIHYFDIGAATIFT